MAINTYAALSPDILLNPSPGCIILSGLKTLNSIISEIFANNEQGFAYDPNDLTTMFQDAAGSVPVTAVGQPVGLMLDKSKGLLLGSELIADPSFDDPSYWTTNSPTVVATGGNAVFANASSGHAINRAGVTTIGRWYVVQVVVTQINSGALRVSVAIGANATGSPNFTTAGTHNFLLQAAGPTNTFQITAIGTTNAIISDVSVRELAGNHAYQTNSSMRPLLVASPQRLDFDTVDDKLTTTLPAQLTGCTVIRAVPNVGAQILKNQTIPTTYNDSTDHCGLIVINRALTATETSQITAIFNKAAGV